MKDVVRPLVRWTGFVPLLGAFVLIAALVFSLEGPITYGISALFLAGSVLAAVHHAEVLAAKVGEPFGALILALAVTIIEVGMILTLMSAGGEGSESLARDTVFSAVMITTNLIVGIALTLATLKHGMVRFNAEGASAALATVIALATLTMVLPALTQSADGPVFTTVQLVFAAIASLALWGSFVATQTVRHRDFFLPVDKEGEPMKGGEEHAEPPSTGETWASAVLLLVALVGVVGLSKVASPAIESFVAGAGLPSSFVGVIIALLVLAPETLAAARAGRRDRVQTSFNLAYGSAIASIGLTVPAIAIISIVGDIPLHLGLSGVEMALLAMTAACSILTVARGRATRQQAAIHLILGIAFLVLAAFP